MPLILLSSLSIICLNSRINEQDVTSIIAAMDGPWFESRSENEIFSSPGMSIPELGPTPPPVQWQTEPFPRVSRPGPEFDPFSPPSVEAKNEWIYASTPPISPS